MRRGAFRLLMMGWLVLAGFGAGAATRQDTLRGSNGRGRDWWDVKRYQLSIEIDTATRTIRGSNAIDFTYKSLHTDSMQIDLQEGLFIDSVTILELSSSGLIEKRVEKIVREGNAWWLSVPLKSHQNKSNRHPILTIYYHGKPREAKNAPWDGGFIWTHDSLDRQWIAVACQGLGASSWWPCKDYQGDEPDNGMTISFTPASYLKRRKVIEHHNDIDTPYSDTLMYISNGIKDVVRAENPMNGSLWDLYSYNIHNPINTYDVSFYIGAYAHWHDTLRGEKGVLDLDFYPLRYNEARAREHWGVVKDMLRCYEYWMGPYPFYEDGYKLVEAPYLGMEHQSAVAYGNKYMMGRLGKNWNGTGVPLPYDYLIIHESGHEWWGNSITARDVADNWLHEGFAVYMETLYAEWMLGKDKAFAYTMDQWKNIRNDRPVIGEYGINDEGSSDKYVKGGAVLHMVRMMINDDKRFRELMRGLNREFYHKIVTSKEVEEYIGRFVGKDLKVFFDAYLRDTAIPILQWTSKEHRGKIILHWSNTLWGFNAPVAVSLDGGKTYMHYSLCPEYIKCSKDIKSEDVKVKPLGLYTVKDEQER